MTTDRLALKLELRRPFDDEVIELPRGVLLAVLRGNRSQRVGVHLGVDEVVLDAVGRYCVCRAEASSRPRAPWEVPMVGECGVDVDSAGLGRSCSGAEASAADVRAAMTRKVMMNSTGSSRDSVNLLHYDRTSTFSESSVTSRNSATDGS